MTSLMDTAKDHTGLAQYLGRAKAANEMFQKSLEAVNNRAVVDETEENPEKKSFMRQIEEAQEKFAPFGKKEVGRDSNSMNH